MSDDKTKKHVYTWEDERVEVHWDRRLCIHIQECTRAGELFESGRDPWCKPELGEADLVAEVVERCPTGALVHRRKDGGAAEVAESANTCVVVNNGPLYLRGDLRVDGAAEDMPGVAFRAALCRCGASSRKPFCDNTHEKVEFKDHGAVGQTGEPGEVGSGPLEVKRANNGPLLVAGPLTILNGAGRPAWKGSKAALCRCGLSKNKPFCDGAHVAGGFEAE